MSTLAKRCIAAVTLVISVTTYAGSILPESDIPPGLQTAIEQEYFELELKVPDAATEAISDSVVLPAERLQQMLSEQKARVILDLGLDVLYDYEFLPLLLVKPPSNESSIKAAAHREVDALHPPKRFQASIAATESSAQIGASLMRAAGYDGTGSSVLVTDAGFDFTSIHSDLGVCTGIGAPASTCRLATYLDLGTHYPSSHGLNVSSIISQSAPGANVHFANVNCGTAADPDCISGSLAMQSLNWAIQNTGALNIVAHNMSWGSSPESPCIYGSSMAAGAAAGIVQVAASGNNSSTTAIGPPASCANVVSVGNLVTASGNTPLPRELWRVSSSSNASSGLDLLAPGTYIFAGGVTMSGTSMASPHVAGLVAILKAPSQWGSLAPEAMERVLKISGAPFVDSRNGMYFPIPDAYKARRLSLTVSNPDGVSYQLAPLSIRSCGTDCYEYPYTYITATLPSGYVMTGCKRTGPSTCGMHIASVQTARIMRWSKLAGIVASVATTNAFSDEIFGHGFE